jgi:hypothetical protein
MVEIVFNFAKSEAVTESEIIGSSILWPFCVFVTIRFRGEADPGIWLKQNDL